ncbi:PKD domain-containing protein [Neolewinella persica]|uniref:PKD domain-containing protein n=1 Tax=Neolewinella persica TaxID=70998 RepID=UPI000380A157|nr:PKD domain-containing protein [Neolewinella persica]
MPTKYLFLLLFLVGFTACDDEQILPSLEDAPVPTELSLDIIMDADNPGDASITPGGRGVTLFSIDFGDGSPAEDMVIGESANHSYTVGSYTVTLTATGINGQTATLTEAITINVLPPRNLVLNISGTPGNTLSINVSATADNADGFHAYFGDVTDEMPTLFQEGETLSHVYAAEGDYDVRVVALSEGMETSLEATETVSVSNGDNAVVLPLNFENTTLDFAWGGFGGAGASVVDNPDVAEGNMSARVVELNKSSGSEVWAGSFLELEGPVDFSASSKIFINVWSPRAGIPVILKLEDAVDADINVEVNAITTMANGWHQLEFDFSGAGDLTIPYEKVVIFFDFGTAGMDENFYFDDISLDPDGSGGGGGGGDEIAFPLDFQNTGISYVFGNFGGAGAEVIDNPDANGLNTSSRVVALTKNSASQVWAGVFIDLDNPIDFSGGQTMKLKVWSPVANAPIMLKLENPDNADDFLEIMVPTTGANQWEELTYDFSGIEAFPNIKRVVLFGNFGTAGTGETYYFDDIRRE